MLDAAADGRLSGWLGDYLDHCKTTSGTDGRREKSVFPNLAGFCRFIGCGIRAIQELRKAYPEIHDRICATFEDEALNSSLSPTLLSAYLKLRLGYGEREGDTATPAECGQLRLVFDHDILEDGV